MNNFTLEGGKVLQKFSERGPYVSKTDMYLHCHGIPTDGINDLGQLVLAVSQTAAKTALAAATTGAALNAVGQPVSPALETLARAIMEKSRMVCVATR